MSLLPKLLQINDLKAELAQHKEHAEMYRFCRDKGHINLTAMPCKLPDGIHIADVVVRAAMKEMRG